MSTLSCYFQFITSVHNFYKTIFSEFSFECNKVYEIPERLLKYLLKVKHKSISMTLSMNTLNGWERLSYNSTDKLFMSNTINVENVLANLHVI